MKGMKYYSVDIGTIFFSESLEEGEILMRIPNNLQETKAGKILRLI
jgi:hypothetical protein